MALHLKLSKIDNNQLLIIYRNNLFLLQGITDFIQDTKSTGVKIMDYTNKSSETGCGKINYLYLELLIFLSDNWHML